MGGHNDDAWFLNGYPTVCFLYLGSCHLRVGYGSERAAFQMFSLLAVHEGGSAA